MSQHYRSLSRHARAILATALFPLLCATASAADFSVTPIRAELKAGALSETITVTNDSPARLRVGIKLMEWTQDAAGKDVYKDSSDLIYFPRQMDIEPGAKRLVRVGAKSPAVGTERAYRLFIEEMPDPGAQTTTAVTFYFRFGVPIFVPPAAGKPELEAAPPSLVNGQLRQAVSNPGNKFLRLNRLTVSDGGQFQQDIAGWYSLAGTSRTYTADIPKDVCRNARKLLVRGEGEGISFERELAVDPSRCG
ncbi:fimbrial biogenesis chaperone [Ramlibacter sp.]|uniref:fimbrial biogenesis chaperone n=1 Tax=Ramlibacter sp. TaxID=1917967 RepID=UPI002D5523E8|nr:fimbria/pilus periplasmic chaperone [Ramlibacter sp.]HYD75654.1 fimbria/pilus periplasmic chaperone [Ramlibacter sp.]